MRFKDVFSIIGPAMVGPSSSHTAGAVRLGLVGMQLLEEVPSRAIITLYGSFAHTYKGHGTDLALVAGLLGWGTADSRIPSALEQAGRVGMELHFRTGAARCAHPNTAELELTGATGHQATLLGASVGGGNIEIQQVDGFQVPFTGGYPTLLVYHRDTPGILAGITGILKEHSMNIGYMKVDRTNRSGSALTVIEADQSVQDDVRRRVADLPGVDRAVCIHLQEGVPE